MKQYRWIDRLIERITKNTQPTNDTFENGTDEAAYQAFCMEQKRKLFGGQYF